MFGGSFFDKIKKGLSVANNFLKSTGAISKLGKYIPHVGPTVSKVVSSLGMVSQAMEKKVVHSTTQEVCWIYEAVSVYLALHSQVSISLINNQKKPFQEKRLFNCFNF